MFQLNTGGKYQACMCCHLHGDTFSNDFNEYILSLIFFISYFITYYHFSCSNLPFFLFYFLTHFYPIDNKMDIFLSSNAWLNSYLNKKCSPFVCENLSERHVKNCWGLYIEKERKKKQWQCYSISRQWVALAQFNLLKFQNDF